MTASRAWADSRTANLEIIKLPRQGDVLDVESRREGRGDLGPKSGRSKKVRKKNEILL